MDAESTGFSQNSCYESKSNDSPSYPRFLGDKDRDQFRYTNFSGHLPSSRVPFYSPNMKFLHTADWQLGKPFARISDPDKGAKVRAARIDSVRQIAKLAQEHDAAFVLVAGDLFDSATPEKSVVSAACSAIGEIGVPVLAIPGNHDHGGPGSLWEQDFFRQEAEGLAPNFRILLTREPVELDDAVILPCPLLRRHESDDPTAWIRGFDFSSLEDPDKPIIALAHGSVHGFESAGTIDEEDDTGSPNLISLDRLPEEEIDFIALGDWHGTKKIDDRAWYSGTQETDRFPKGTDNDPGNILSVELKRGSTATVEKIETAELSWHSLSFAFTDDDLDRFESELQETIGSRAGEDLLLLELSGSLGIDAAAQLDQKLETLDSRLLRLKLRNRIRLAPSEEEVTSLAERPSDPLISRVAETLIAEASGDDEDAEVARIALRELHAATTE